MSSRAAKRALKALRASQPFNCLATSVIRALLGMTGLRSDLVVRHLHRVGIVRCPLPNGRTLLLRSHGDDWIPNQIYWKGWLGYEPETAGVFFRLATRASATLDIGAHIGFFTLLAAHANVEAILGPLGYQYYLLTPDGPVLRQEVKGVRGVRNWLFTTLPDQEVIALWQA